MKKGLIIVVLVAILSLAVLPQIASAATSGRGNLNLGMDKVRKYINLGTQDLRITVANIINVAMGLLGIVAVCIILLGGFKWMTAGGSEDKVKEAKKLIVAGVVGLAIILCAFAIANFVVGSLMSATNQ